MHSNESSWNPDEIVDTKSLQLFTLREFMKCLNYDFVEGTLWSNPFFHSSHHSNKGRNIIGFVGALKLYNGNSVKCVFGKPPEKLSLWSFNDYQIAKAKAARILVRLKLQLCKSTKTILVQDHRVEFTLKSYSKLFLSNKYLG